MFGKPLPDLIEIAEPAADPERQAQLTTRAKRLYADRRRRDRVFGSNARHFQEPAWDMLLDLFVAQAEDKPVSISSACVAACVPPTTGLRWIGFLKDAGMVQENADERDRRRRFVSLTPAMLSMMTHYLSELD
jgi:hypothetical protein